MRGNLGKCAMNLQGWVRYVQSADGAHRAQIVAAVFGLLGAEVDAALTITGLEQELEWRDAIVSPHGKA